MRKSRLFVLAVTAVALLSGPAVPADATAGATVLQENDGGPQVFVETPDIRWGEDSVGMTAYAWQSRVENPNDRPVLVKVELNFVDQQGQVLYQDWVSGHIGPNSAVILQQEGTIPTGTLDVVAEARGVPSAWWADEPYQVRTIAAFVDGLQRMDVFFVLENWEGRPVTSDGTVDLYIVERQKLEADFAGGGMRREQRTLYARRFNVSSSDFERRQIGFISTDYSPPALSLGPLHYSMFDHYPVGDEGMIRLVFRTPSGVEIIAEDRIFF